MQWPEEDPPMVVGTLVLSPTIREKYQAVITHLTTKVPQKQVDWLKIMGTTQEPKESVHAYYKRLM